MLRTRLVYVLFGPPPVHKKIFKKRKYPVHTLILYYAYLRAQREYTIEINTIPNLSNFFRLGIS